jgi:hypothetical protein
MGYFVFDTVRKLGAKYTTLFVGQYAMMSIAIVMKEVSFFVTFFGSFVDNIV